MAKYVYWQIDNNNIVQMHKITALPDAIKKEPLLGLFEFEISRYKDSSSKKEELKITTTINTDDYGTISTSIANMESDIALFKANGIILDRPKYVELCRLILDNYYYFDPIIIAEIDFVVTDAVADEVLAMMCQYIIDKGIKSQEVTDRKKGHLNLYHIPLRDFNNELSDSQLRKYNVTEIKAKLLEKHYIHVNQGKLDYVVNENGQRTKMVSIHKEIAEPILEGLCDRQ